MVKLVLVALDLIISGLTIGSAHAFPAITPPEINPPQQAEPVQWRDRDGGSYGGYGVIVGGALTPPHYGPYRAAYYDSSYGYQRRQYSYYRPYREYEPSVAYEGGSHVSWCYGRYRTYRAFDNTFQPYYGPRRECVGPYRWR
ncbi:BA14K-like protein [Rhizobium tibeticum]|uniref:Lectin-like protein BA14k n=1 Tax=Rhizobium tibeticum TaxID=501024 RepID=A0A1H8RT54_9HYPH|nr:BA14K family protein [Rhizobium tibeticum]SEI08629.1 Lectin-like protein BA14k precursor [Rhizobium tibeticum]SEO69364.1 BA14K-like protein [Rhizobium tibeticum]